MHQASRSLGIDIQKKDCDILRSSTKVAISSFFSCDLRRRRCGSVSTITPHQCWNVYDYEGALKQFNDTSTRMLAMRPVLPRHIPLHGRCA